MTSVLAPGGLHTSTLAQYIGNSAVALAVGELEEVDAPQKLKDERAKHVATDKRICCAETTTGGFVSYVELLICLELANDMRNDTVAARTPLKGKDRKAGGDTLQ